MLHFLPVLKGCEGKHVTVSQTLPASPSLFWTPAIPTQLVESLLPTHCLSCSVSTFVSTVFPLSAFSSLFHSSGTWPGQLPALQASQSRGPCSPGSFPFLFTAHFWYYFGTPALSGTILLSPSSTFLPIKTYAIFCLFLSPLCLFVCFSHLVVQEPLRSSASPMRYLSLSLWLHCPSLFPGDLVKVPGSHSSKS